jgi:hypothetical protein
VHNGSHPGPGWDEPEWTVEPGEALAGLRQRQPGHDLGRVAMDLAVMLADGGEAISDLAVLRGQEQLFGRWQGPTGRWTPVPSVCLPARAPTCLSTTVWGSKTHACRMSWHFVLYLDREGCSRRTRSDLDALRVEHVHMECLAC